MDVSSLGPSGLDPFAPTSGPAPDDTRETAPAEAHESAPLPEGSGTQVDTSA